jgi:aldose 1-epimerase
VTTQPTGAQWTIRHAGQEATVVEVGGGLRTYTVNGVDVIAGYDLARAPQWGRGQLLMPWPNRIRDGRYDFDGRVHQLALTEPARGNATHGLVRWAVWGLESLDADAVTLTHRLFPQPGWDGCLELSVRYALGDHGLTVSSRAVNVGRARVPFGYGAHPYLALGTTSLAEVVLTVPASREVLVDERLLPAGTGPVRPEVDFRTGRAVGDARLDTAYTQLARGAQGAWTVTLGGFRDRPGVSVWGDEAFGWVQVFTKLGEDGAVDGPRGIAVEPMSCPADAFNSGEGLVVLEPGQSWGGAWGIRPDGLS